MALGLSPPGQFRGTVQEQLRQCYSYLFQLHRQLDTALQALPRSGEVAVTGSSGREAKAGNNAAGEAESLRALIIQNATLVRREMDRLETELKGSYVAVSDFGTYLQELNALIQADPEAVTQYYSFLSSLEANVDRVDTAFQTYLQQTEGYIRTGVVDWEAGLPIYGVAVGQGLTTTETDGETVVSSQQFRSTFTARRLSFWQGDVEVAYLSDNRLYITNITILGTMNLGNAWAVTHSGGFTVKWIGA